MPGEVNKYELLEEISGRYDVNIIILTEGILL